MNSKSRIISTDEDPSLRIESSAIINLRGVSTKLNKYIIFTMQTYLGSPIVIIIQLRNTDNIPTDLYILLKPQSELGYLGNIQET